MSDNLTDLILGLAKEAKREAYESRVARANAKAQEPTPREVRLARMADSRWTDESIVQLVTESRCACGANYEHPHAGLFIRRYHPIWGVHFEHLAYRPIVTSMTYRIDRHIRDISHCHRCLTQHDVDSLISQMSLFPQEQCA